MRSFQSAGRPISEVPIALRIDGGQWKRVTPPLKFLEVAGLGRSVPSCEKPAKGQNMDEMTAVRHMPRAAPAPDTDVLFQPYRLGPFKLPHRIVMAPLTRSRARQPGNVPSSLAACYYAQRASAALITCEPTQVF